jgi:hypothetical protein
MKIKSRWSDADLTAHTPRQLADRQLDVRRALMAEPATTLWIERTYRASAEADVGRRRDPTAAA